MRSQQRQTPAKLSKYPMEFVLTGEEFLSLIDCDPDALAKAEAFSRQFRLRPPTMATPKSVDKAKQSE